MRLRIWMNETRQTFKLATPIMAGNVAQMLMGAIDTLMVGRLGVTPLAACAFANSLIAFLLLLALGMMQPISIVGAHALGARRPAALAEIIRCGIWIGSALGLLLGIFCSFSYGALDFFGQPGAVSEAAKPFYVIVGWSILPMALTIGLKQFSETLGQPWIPMLIIFAGVGLNAFLNWIMIFGAWGFPALGLEGAAWATLIARIATLFLLLIWILKTPSFREVWPQNWLALPCVRRLREMLFLGWPVALQLMLEVGAFGFAAILMGWISEESLAAHQVALTCAATTFMVPLGISAAVSIRLGNAWGAGEWQQVRDIGFSAFAVTLLLMSCTALLLVLGRHDIPRWFVSPGEGVEQVLEISAGLLIVAGIFQLADGVQIVGHGCLRGMRDVRTPTWISLFAYWGVALPMGWALGIAGNWGGMGVWTGLAVGLAFAAVALVARFVKLSQEHKRHLQHGLLPDW